MYGKRLAYLCVYEVSKYFGLWFFLGGLFFYGSVINIDDTATFTANTAHGDGGEQSFRASIPSWSSAEVKVRLDPNVTRNLSGR